MAQPTSVVEPSRLLVARTEQSATANQPAEEYTKTGAAKQPTKILTRPLSISISRTTQTGIENQQADTHTLTPKQATVLENKHIKYEDFKSAWTQFGSTLSHEQLIVFRNFNEPVCVSEQHYQLTVSNSMQENEAKKLLADAMHYLRSTLHNSNIRITTHIEEDTLTHRSLLPEQIYQEMVSRNPYLEVFRKNMKLEID